MNVLDLTPPLRFNVPLLPLVIAFVGAGGTGSHLLHNLVKLVLHAQDRALPPIKLVVIDGDTVERSNTRGRQFFTGRDIGYNKAEVLAARFNAAYGLTIVAVPEMATPDILHAFAPDGQRSVGVLVGCVDRPSGRRALHAALRSGAWRIWLDCGNGKDGGQVCWGTTARRKAMAGALLMPPLCTEVPGPSLQFPQLLTLGEETPVIDCAQRVAWGEQDLLINVQMAAIAALYLQKLIIDRTIDHLHTQVALNPPMASTQMLTEAALAQFAKVTPARLHGEKRRTLRREGLLQLRQRRINRRITHQQGRTV